MTISGSPPTTEPLTFFLSPLQVAILLGFLTLAAAFYFVFGRGNAAGKGKKPLIVTFFTDPNEAGGKNGAKASSSALEFRKLKLVSRTNETHDTIVLRFALPHHGRCVEDKLSPTSASQQCTQRMIEIAGIAPSRHVHIRASIDGEMVQRSFSPTSCAVDEAHCGLFDLHVKVYRADPSKGLKGGVMSTFLDSLPVGSEVEMRGPTGIVQYAGNGAFLVGTGAGGKARKVVSGKHLVLIAGGSGITPIVAVLKAILHGKLGGMKVPAASKFIAPASPTTAAALSGGDDANAPSPIARREYLRGECRHSFYEANPTCLDESAADGIERITFSCCNHSIADVMFRDWLLGEDAEHSCYGAFAALAEAGGVPVNTENSFENQNAHAEIVSTLKALAAANYTAKPIDVSMNFHITRPSASDTKAMAAANALWSKQEAAMWGGSSNKQQAIVTRRYVSGRPTLDSIKQCMAVGGNADTSSAVRARYDPLSATPAEVEESTVALLCGPPGLLDDVARPALVSAGVAKSKVLLA